MVIDELVDRGGSTEGAFPTAAAHSSLIGFSNVIGNKGAARLAEDIGTLDFRMEFDFDRRVGCRLTKSMCHLRLSSRRSPLMASQPGRLRSRDGEILEMLPDLLQSSSCSSC